jgi:hypothetical protein
VIGEGIKKTLGYDTPYSIEQLAKWREEFWGKLTQISAISKTSIFNYPVFRDKNVRFDAGMDTA